MLEKFPVTQNSFILIKNVLIWTIWLVLYYIQYGRLAVSVASWAGKQMAQVRYCLLPTMGKLWLSACDHIKLSNVFFVDRVKLGPIGP